MPEIILKFNEAAGLPFEGFSAGDFMHCPRHVGWPGYSTVPVDSGGHCAEAADQGQPVLTTTLALKTPLLEVHTTIGALVLGQLVALEAGRLRSTDTSLPRGLAR